MEPRSSDAWKIIDAANNTAEPRFRGLTRDSTTVVSHMVIDRGHRHARASKHADQALSSVGSEMSRHDSVTPLTMLASIGAVAPSESGAVRTLAPGTRFLLMQMHLRSALKCQPREPRGSRGEARATPGRRSDLRCSPRNRDHSRAQGHARPPDAWPARERRDPSRAVRLRHRAT